MLLHLQSEILSPQTELDFRGFYSRLVTPKGSEPPPRSEIQWTDTLSDDKWAPNGLMFYDIVADTIGEDDLLMARSQALNLPSHATGVKSVIYAYLNMRSTFMEWGDKRVF